MSLPSQNPKTCNEWLLELYQQEVDASATTLPTELSSFGYDVQGYFSDMSDSPKISTRSIPALIFKMWQAGMIV